MKILMKSLFRKPHSLFLLFNFLITSPGLAAGAQYFLKIDGLACPFCSYEIEKKLLTTEGVSSVIIDIDKGLVTVIVTEGVELTAEHMNQIIQDAGFTLKEMTIKPES